METSPVFSSDLLKCVRLPKLTNEAASQLDSKIGAQRVEENIRTFKKIAALPSAFRENELRGLSQMQGKLQLGAAKRCLTPSKRIIINMSGATFPMTKQAVITTDTDSIGVIQAANKPISISPDSGFPENSSISTEAERQAKTTTSELFSSKMSATERLLDKWEININYNQPDDRALPSITLPDLHAGKAVSLVGNHFRSFSPNKTSLTAADTWKMSTSKAVKLDPLSERVAVTSVPVHTRKEDDMANDSVTDSFQLRKDYGKNLERNWYEQMQMKEKNQRDHKRYNHLVDTFNLDKTMDEFYKAFYSSGSDTDDDVSIHLPGVSAVSVRGENGKRMYGQETFKGADSDGDRALSDGDAPEPCASPFLRFASTDVLLGDSDEDSGSDIEIIMRDNQLVDRRIKYKSRRMRYRQETKYQRLYQDHNSGVGYSNGGYMSDVDLRAMRLKLIKSREDTKGYTETCTLSELKEEVMKALSRLNRTRKSDGKKKKKKTSKTKKEGLDQGGYGEHQGQSLYKRFLSEYGFLLDGYTPGGISGSDASSSESEESHTIDKVKCDLPGSSNIIASKYTCLTAVAKLKSNIVERTSDRERLRRDSNYSRRRISKDKQSESNISPPSPPVEKASVEQVAAPKKRCRLKRVLKSLMAQMEKISALLPASRKARHPGRRMSDPGVRCGKALLQQKVIREIKSDSSNRGRGGNAKRRRKAVNGRSTNLFPKVTLQGKIRPQESLHKFERRKILETPAEAGEESENLERCEDIDISVDPTTLRRTKSARWFRPGKDPAISLRALLKDLEFPAKEVKLQIFERKLQRQKRRKERSKVRQERLRLEDLARKERRQRDLASRLQYLIQQRESSQTENAKTNDTECSDEKAACLAATLKQSRGKRNTGQTDYSYLLKSPYVSACVSWQETSEPVKQLTTPYTDVYGHPLISSELFIEMKDCKYIRWPRQDQNIIDRLTELELETY